MNTDAGAPRNPQNYPRRVLLLVAGLSPQVITEAIYALAVDGSDAWIPTEVQVVTTAEGAERVRLALLSDQPGWFHRLRADYDLPPIQFGPAHIHIVRDAAGRPLADIRSVEDSHQAADQITERVRALTADPDCALHVSIAGGRKTMGYYVGYAVSLFGRPQDRLSHVLVSEAFESNWEFFYPAPASRVMTTRDNKLVDAAEARVTLAEIPFLRLREGLPKRLIDGAATFGESVEAAQRALAPPDLVIDLAGGRIRAGGESVSLAPATLAFYALMARRRLKGMHAARWDTEGLDRQYLAEYRRIAGDLSGDLERVAEALADGMTQEYFEQRKSRTNTALESALGPQLSAPYLIHGDGSRPYTRFGLRIAPEAIRFAAVGSSPLTTGEETASLSHSKRPGDL
jgi:CRISPR-associated protein (TIGR02584 family)